MTPPRPDLLYFNGVDGSTGRYLVPPATEEQLAQAVQQDPNPPEPGVRRKPGPTLGARFGIDETDLAEAGWGVMFAAGADRSVQDALGPLLRHREGLATRQEPRYHVYDDEKEAAYQPGDTRSTFLTRLGASPGSFDPAVVPYYLLIVGDPETIPFRFQSQLDAGRAVGRIHFDSLDEYRSYAESIVTAETTAAKRERRVTFFGPRNAGDVATDLSMNHLVSPLAKLIADGNPDWTVATVLEAEATRARLGRILGGDDTPALVFSASHGIGFPSAHEWQSRDQGALLCQDWPGPDTEGFSQDWYFAARDVPDGANLIGTLAFHFACFGGGTPRLDEFAHLLKGALEPREIAPAAFVAALPRRLLGHPNGGALAVIGHVERTWDTSFVWDGAGDQLTVFRSTLERLLAGQPVGHALQDFNVRYLELQAMLADELYDIGYRGTRVESSALARLWMATNDARGYSLIGDPAVRLAVAPT